MYGITESAVLDIDVSTLVATNGVDATPMELDIRNVETGEREVAIVHFTNVAVRQLKTTAAMLSNLAVRAFLFNIGETPGHGWVISTQNVEQLFRLDVTSETRNLLVAKLIHSFFIRLPNMYLSEDALWNSTLFTPK
jgi:hypothetical protein